MATHNVVKSRLIAAPPSFVIAVQANLIHYLNGLPAPDFKSVADQKALWATEADDASLDSAEGSVHPGAGNGTATAFVVSAETYKRIQARRYTNPY